MKRILKIIFAVLVTLVGMKLLQAALPPIAPFLLSFTAAAVMEPVIAALECRGVKRSLAAGLLTAIILLL